jgi:hypothetical protein
VSVVACIEKGNRLRTVPQFQAAAAEDLETFAELGAIRDERLRS